MFRSLRSVILFEIAYELRRNAFELRKIAFELRPLYALEMFAKASDFKMFTNFYSEL